MNIIGALSHAREDAAAARILIVDHDAGLRGKLVGYLEEQNMRAVSADSREEMLRHFADCEPNLVLLDLRFGKDDGLDLLRAIRLRSNVPVIVMNGHGHDEMDRVVGLELGADDYVTEPFGLREILARMRAMLRRHDLGRPPPKHQPAPKGFSFEGWQLDLRARRLVNPDGLDVALTRGEYTLLVAFLTAPGRSLTREHLSRATHVHDDVFDRSIDVRVLRLRRKLEAGRRAPRAIKTERGVGYCFSLPVQRY